MKPSCQPYAPNLCMGTSALCFKANWNVSIELCRQKDRLEFCFFYALAKLKYIEMNYNLRPNNCFKNR